MADDDTVPETVQIDYEAQLQLELHAYKSYDSHSDELDRRADQALILTNAGGALAILTFIAQAKGERIYEGTIGGLAIFSLTLFVFGAALIIACALLAAVYYERSTTYIGVKMGYLPKDEMPKKLGEGFILLARIGQWLSLIAFVMGFILGAIALSQYLKVTKPVHPFISVPFDSDTFRYGDQKVRIMDIDTPEPSRYGNAKCLSEAMLGDLAKAFTKEIITTREIKVELSEEIGEDGFALAKVRVGDEYLGDMLLDAGLALLWTGRRVDWCR